MQVIKRSISPLLGCCSVSSTASDRVRVFERVRNVRYWLNQSDPDSMFRLNKGSCHAKHTFLARRFEEMGLDVKCLSARYDWRKQPIPEHMLGRLEPWGYYDYHLALVMRTGDHWVVVDATWDPPLGLLGFPVNRAWDGFGSMGLAVVPEQVFVPDVELALPSVVSREEFRRYLDPWLAHAESRSHEIEIAARSFSAALNNWFEAVRRKAREGKRGDGCG